MIFKSHCISIGGKWISEIANTAILINWFPSTDGNAISEMCKTVIFKNHCIFICGKAISEIAKTAMFTNWLLSSGGSMTL